MVNFRAGLLGVWSLADIVIHAAGADAARECRVARTDQGNDVRLPFRSRGVSAGADNARRISSCTSSSRETKDLISLIGLRGVGHREHLRRYSNVLPGEAVARSTRRDLRTASEARDHFLRVGNKEERQVVAVIKHSEAGSNHGLAVGRPGDADAGLPVAVVRLHILGKARLVVPAQPKVHRELGSEPPLVLCIETPVTVIDFLAEGVE